MIDQAVRDEPVLTVPAVEKMFGMPRRQLYTLEARDHVAFKFAPDGSPRLTPRQAVWVGVARKISRKTGIKMPTALDLAEAMDDTGWAVVNDVSIIVDPGDVVARVAAAVREVRP